MQLLGITLRVRGQLLAFGAVLVLLLGLVGLLGVLMVGSVGGAGSHLANVVLPSSELVGTQRIDAEAVRRRQYEAVTLTDAAERKGTQGEIADGAAAVAKEFAAYRELVHDPGALAAAAKTEEAWQAYLAASTPALALPVSGQEQALEIMTTADEQWSTFEEVSDGWRTIATAQAKASAHEIETTNTTARLILFGLMAVAVLVAISGALWLARRLTRALAPVNACLTSLRDECVADLTLGLERVAEGDLTFAITPTATEVEAPGVDEIGDAGRTANAIRASTLASVDRYNAMRERLAATIGEISRTTVSVADASQRMAATSEQSGRIVGEIAQAVTEVASGAEHQVQIVGDARRVAEDARTAADRGSATAQAMAEAMSELDAKSIAITGIVRTIAGIAEQTNLLALNAAIEAARAGEHGRGFAVVAEEVRKLAEDSQTAAGSIEGLIGEIQAASSEAVRVVNDEAVGAFGAIAQQISDVHDALARIASVSEETSAATEEVSASTEQSNVSSQEVATAAQGLAGDATTLQQLVDRFSTR